jgi:alanyl-tRNA synthetase
MGGHRVITIDSCPNPIMLKNAAMMLQNEMENLVVAAAYEVEGKPQLLLMYSRDLVAAGKNAQADIKEAAKFIQGGGGGQPGLATAGGRNLAGLNDALETMVAAATR